MAQTAIQNEQIHYALHPTQAAVWEGAARFRVVAAGRRWGKTRLAALRLLTEGLNTPRQRFWYVAPTRVMAKDILWADLKQLCHPAWQSGPPLETELTLSLINGTSLRLMGAEDPDSLRGRGIAGVILDEFADMAEEAWTEALRPALADTSGWAWFVGTPKSFNHFYSLFLLGQTGQADWQSWQFRTVDNPFIDAAEVDFAKRDMDARTYRQEFEASFEALSGRVYYAFSRHTHVQPVPLEPSVPVLLSFDFNIDPCCAVICQRVGDEVRVWREVKIRHAGGEATRATAKRVQALLTEAGWRGACRLYGDPAGRAAKTTGPSDHAVLRDVFGASVSNQIRGHAPHVRDRIAAVNGRCETLDGRRHLLVDPSCVGLIADLEQVTFTAKGDLDKDSNPELTHLSDALGYLIEREFPARSPVQIGAGHFAHLL